MSSIEPWSSSSTPERAHPRGHAPYRDVYTGLEYREAFARPLDPLVHPDPYRPPRAYRLLYAIVRLVLRLLFRCRVEGQEHVPRPPFIIASNHQAWFDSLFIVAAFPRLPMIYTMARRDTVFNRGWKRRLVPQFGAFPIQPFSGHLDERAVTTVYQLLARGGVVLIFPEGRYSRGRQMRPLKRGVAHFSLNAGVPICPVAISGIDRLRPFGRVEVLIVPPIWPDPPSWWSLNRRVVSMVDRVRRAILHAFGSQAVERPAGRLGRVSGRGRAQAVRPRVRGRPLPAQRANGPRPP